MGGGSWQPAIVTAGIADPGRKVRAWGPVCQNPWGWGGGCHSLHVSVSGQFCVCLARSAPPPLESLCSGKLSDWAGVLVAFKVASKFKGSAETSFHLQLQEPWPCPFSGASWIGELLPSESAGLGQLGWRGEPTTDWFPLV